MGISLLGSPIYVIQYLYAQPRKRGRCDKAIIDIQHINISCHASIVICLGIHNLLIISRFMTYCYL